MDIQNLKALLEPAKPFVEDHSTIIVITMHKYRPQIAAMTKFMEMEGFRLISVLHVKHDNCSGSGREFWWGKNV